MSFAFDVTLSMIMTFVSNFPNANSIMNLVMQFTHG
jgi:hypothetical protein